MTTCIYLASAESQSGKSAVALGLVEQLVRRGGRVGVFRPIVRSSGADPLLELLLPRTGSTVPADQSFGVTYEDIHHSTDTAISRIVDRYHDYAEQHDAVLIIGSDFTDVPGPAEFAVNASIAANVGAPIILVVPGGDRSGRELATSAELMTAEARSRHARVLAVIANRIDTDVVEETGDALRATFPDTPTFVLPASPVLAAPTVRDLMEATGARFLPDSADPDDELLDREALSLIVAGMTMPNVLDRLVDGAVVICPADREEVLLVSLMAHRSSTFPSLAGVILNGGFDLSPQVRRLIEGLTVELPVLTTGTGTFRTATAAYSARPRIGPHSRRKIKTAIDLADAHLSIERLLPQAGPRSAGVVTPLMFEHQLADWARRAETTIVLPEGHEDRILRASDVVLARHLADITLLGDPDQIRRRAAELGLDISAAHIIDPATDSNREQFAQTYAELRAHRGVTIDQARDTVADPAYFGTLMVRSGLAEGMVSGSATTTAHTVRPALEVIRTVPGVSVVSSVFFMCLADKVLVYGDCAINPDPNPEQLADIAISSAATADAFGVSPRVAMLSYSTGGSGRGADVDKVREATAIVRERAPQLLVEGPIQYDAAVDPEVAATKVRDSPVAGQATVLIFPDLNTGNNTYKAVQRSAHAVAVGPVLQGLNAPVNDLSRGATVRDIVNTVAITAVQARHRSTTRGGGRR